jgi:hypothetical protein
VAIKILATINFIPVIFLAAQVMATRIIQRTASTGAMRLSTIKVPVCRTVFIRMRPNLVLR